MGHRSQSDALSTSGSPSLPGKVGVFSTPETTWLFGDLGREIAELRAFELDRVGLPYLLESKMRPFPRSPWRKQSLILDLSTSPGQAGAVALALGLGSQPLPALGWGAGRGQGGDCMGETMQCVGGQGAGSTAPILTWPRATAAAWLGLGPGLMHWVASGRGS